MQGFGWKIQKETIFRNLGVGG